MRAEVSCPISLNILRPTVNDILLGDRVRLKYEFESGWLENVKAKCPKIAAKERLEIHPYTHRFFVEIENVEDTFDKQLDQAKQLIIQSIFVSRLVKPIAIASANIWIEALLSDSGNVEYHCDIRAGFQSQAYVASADVENSLSEEDAKQVSNLWHSLQYFLINESKYRRIVRAIKLVEIAYHIYYSEIRHTTFHAALESLICTSSKQNKKQVTKRLPQLVSFVTEAQAELIYKLCCDLKHAAAPLQLFPTGTENLDPRDQPRHDAVVQLEQAVRHILLRALSDRNFADVVADPNLLQKTYLV